MATYTDTLTPTQLAQLLNVSYSAIMKAIHAGRLPCSANKQANGRYEINRNLAIQEWQNNTNPQPPTPVPVACPLPIPTYQNSRAIQKYYQAKLMELKYEKEKGNTVNKDEVDRDLSELGQKVRRAVMNVPGQMSACLAVETEVGKICQLLESALNAALTRVAKQ